MSAWDGIEGEGCLACRMCLEDRIRAAVCLICCFLNSPKTHVLKDAFLEPVDWRALGLTDYPIVIKQPMDLGTIKVRACGRAGVRASVRAGIWSCEAA